MQYDISGPNDQATINAIDEALTATGATKPAPITLAPDFTITDIHGQVHHLYADYLNQGKRFYSKYSIPLVPMQYNGPLMEPFYQEWGAGDYDVEFIELSDKNFDTNPLVTAYQSTYDETFIAAGKMEEVWMQYNLTKWIVRSMVRNPNLCGDCSGQNRSV